MKLNLSEIAEITNGEIHSALPGDEVEASGVSTDSRSMKAGNLFIALIGNYFDAHEMIEKGSVDVAAALLVQRKVNAKIPQVIVKNTYVALQQLAVAWRKRFSLPLIGVTGSNGKTSVKELIKQILSTQGNVLATVGNLNNHIGVPLTLLNLNQNHRFAVIEMGANHAGEIAVLAKLAEPNIGVVTNIGPAHLEGFGSIEGVAHAKAEMYQNLTANGVAVVNADEYYIEILQKEIGERMQISFGIEKQADVSGKQIASDQIEITTPVGAIRVKPRVSGMHALLNTLAATAVGLALGLDLKDIKTGIENTQTVPGRLVRIEGLGGACVLDDSYNANPASLAVALHAQAQEPGEHWLVLGDMGELGDESVFMHQQAGEIAKECGVTRLFAYGDLTKHSVEKFGAGATHFNSHSMLVEKLQDELAAGICVLVKGSRAMKLEKVVAGIRANSLASQVKLNGKTNGQVNTGRNEHAA